MASEIQGRNIDWANIDPTVAQYLRSQGYSPDVPLKGHTRHLEAIGVLEGQVPKRKQRGRGETPIATVKLTQRIRISGWHPAALNRVMQGHWSNGHRAKKADRDVIAQAETELQLRWAQGHRRVKLTIFLRPKQRACDPDAYWKSLLDALVYSHLLIDDSRQHCTLEGVDFVRAEEAATLIELEDI